MLKSAPKKGGASASFMASLHLSLAALAFLTVPAILDLLSIPLGFNAEVDLGAMAWVLGRTILLPVALGIGARALSAPLADRFAPVLEKIGMLGIAVVAVVALAAFYPTLLAMAPWSYAVILCVSLAALAIGHFLGATDPHERTTLAVECAVRHPVLAISIAALNFSPAKALPVLVPCVITCIVVAIVYINLRGRSLRNAVAHA
jgi:BASS family bile acid:Na+ symporter